jgi:hypothetical protein
LFVGLKMLVPDAEQRVLGREVQVGTLLELGKTTRHRQEAVGYTRVVVHLALTHHVVLPVPGVSTIVLKSRLVETADQPELNALFFSEGVCVLLDDSHHMALRLTQVRLLPKAEVGGHLSR